MHPKTPLSAAALALAAATLAAQTSTVANVPVATTFSTDGAHAVSGVNIKALPDGTVWFMIPSSDRIVSMSGTTFKQWQIREDKSIGANPVKFEFDGNVMWFICNGESLIDAGRSILARLDTVTGALREYVLPGSKPAGFWRAPDGKVWVPQTDGRLQSLDLATLQVTDYRSRSADAKTFTFAYSGIAHGPDGALWMTDFGNNRIVRFEPEADTETSWTFLDPAGGRLNPSQIQFDADGRLWMSMLSGAAIDVFDPTSNALVAYTGFLTPIHFDMFQGKVYVAEASTGDGSVAVLDRALAFPTGVVLTPVTVPVHHIVNPKPALIRDSVITPTTFTSTPKSLGTSDLIVTAGVVNSGILRTEFASINAWGITVADGYLWVGSNGAILKMQLQNIGGDSDLTVPVAYQNANDPALTLVGNHVDVALANAGDSTISGNLLYLYSPSALAATIPFTVNPRSTSVVEDVFRSVVSQGFSVHGPVRVQVAGGTAADLTASVRTTRTNADGHSFGFLLPAVNTAACLGAGDQATLFTANRDTETSDLVLFTSSAGLGSQSTLRLIASDGTVRATRDFNLANNTLEEYTPAASAFGLAAQAGDTVQILGGPGSLRAYCRIVDSGSTDEALSMPAMAWGDAVLPWAETGLGEDGTGPVSDLYVSNPDPANPASITISYYASGAPAAPRSTTMTLAPGTAQVVADALASLFGVASGSGALVVSSNTPIASAVRIAARKTEGDYATLINAYPQAIPAGGSASASGLQEIRDLRSTDLVLFNRGGATAVNVVGLDGNGNEVNTIPVPLGPGQSRRLAAIFQAISPDNSDIRNWRIRLDAPAGSQLYAAFAVTETTTGDVEFVAPTLLPPAGGVFNSSAGRDRVVSNPGPVRRPLDIPHR